MAAGDIWRMSIKGLIGADENMNVVHYRVVSGGGTPVEDAEALADAWASDAMAEYLNCLNAVYAIKTLSVRGITHPTWGWDRTVTGSGAGGGEVSPTQTCALVNLRTGRIGRPYMGKQYLPALSESNVSNGSIIPALVAAIDTYFSEALVVVSTTLPLTTFEWVVYSKELNEANTITDYFVSPFARTQRRRTPGVGA